MKRIRMRKHLAWLLVLVIVFSAGYGGTLANVMAKSPKTDTVTSASLKIGNEKVTKKTYKMKQGEKKKVKVSISPKRDNKTITFTTSNKAVAAVSKSGRITAKKVGTAKITVAVKSKKTEASAKSRGSVKKLTWVKIKVVNEAVSNDDTVTEEPHTPDNSTQEPPLTESPNVTSAPGPTESPSATEQPNVTPVPDVSESPSVPENPSQPPTGTPDISGNKKSIVVYFSCTDNTKTIAEYVAESTGADIYRIEAAEPYTSEDLNYNNSDSRSSKEQNNPLARPAIAGELLSLDGYENVYLGYPIWWGQAPKIMYTFIEHYNLSGKTIIPFCTSASSGIGTSATNLQAADINQAVWLAGRRFSGNSPKSDIENWILGLELQ